MSDLRQGVTKVGHDVLDRVQEIKAGPIMKIMANAKVEDTLLAVKHIFSAILAQPDPETRRNIVNAAALLIIAVEHMDAEQ